jgi:hypothetical protein
LINEIDWEPGNKSENGAFIYSAQFSKIEQEKTILAAATGLN